MFTCKFFYIFVPSFTTKAKIMNENAKEVLRVQKKQYTMGLEWISIIESPLTSPDDRKIAVEQLAILNNSILELQAVVAQNELVCFS